MKVAKVYLVGAGPGDPGLMTVRGLQLLRAAQVVVYDQLVNPVLLEEVTVKAERIFVGKQAGKHCIAQSEINAVLIGYASAGIDVVRLKGGDPFVFGRGGEEAEALADAGIPFEIVPGVSSAVAVPAYAGIPLTHRDYASSFAVVTGHEALKTKSSVDWSKLATAVDTLVILMGLHNLPAIAAKLRANGCPEETPVAVIRQGTTAEPASRDRHAGRHRREKRRIQSAGTDCRRRSGQLQRKLDWFTDKLADSSDSASSDRDDVSVRI